MEGFFGLNALAPPPTLPTCNLSGNDNSFNKTPLPFRISKNFPQGGGCSMEISGNRTLHFTIFKMWNGQKLDQKYVSMTTHSSYSPLSIPSERWHLFLKNFPWLSFVYEEYLPIKNNWKVKHLQMCNHGCFFENNQQTLSITLIDTKNDFINLSRKNSWWSRFSR